MGASGGFYNTFVGFAAGYPTSTGDQNSIFGCYAGQSNNTGSGNTFLGYNAGNSNTSGYQNIFIGSNAGNSNSTGYDNIFIGESSGNNNSIGYWNTFIGNDAGYTNTSGDQNVFLGYIAGYDNTTGGYNVFIGAGAGSNNTLGNGNTFIGEGVGTLNTTGALNTSLGYRAGWMNTTGIQNVFLGSYAGYNETGSNKLYIENCKYDAADTSNPLIYGEFDNNLVKINGNFMITGYLSLNAGTTQINSTEINLLDGKTSVSTGTPDNDKLVTKGYVDTYDDVGGGLTGNLMTNQYICKWDDGGSSLVDSKISESSEAIYINGKLGVGTQSPAYPLEVETTGADAVFAIDRTDGATGKIAVGTNGVQFGAISDSKIHFITANSQKRLTIGKNGYIGIGDGSPSYPIEVGIANGAYLNISGNWVNPSRRKLKENIEELTADEAIDALNGLNPVKYNYKVDKEEKCVGFIAEDVPDLVAVKDRKGMVAMDVVAVLTKVVQKQQKMMQEHQKTITELKQEIAELKKK